MRGILRVMIVVGLILLPVVLMGGDRVSLVGESNVVVGEGRSGGVMALFSGDDGGSGVHNQQPHDGPPLQEAWPWPGWHQFRFSTYLGARKWILLYVCTKFEIKKLWEKIHSSEFESYRE